jgi:hypothetical protein
LKKSDGSGTAQVIFKLAKQLGATALHRGYELPAKESIPLKTSFEEGSGL